MLLIEIAVRLFFFSFLFHLKIAYHQLPMPFMCSLLSCGRYSRHEELLKSSKARQKENAEAGLDKIQDLMAQ